MDKKSIRITMFNHFVAILVALLVIYIFTLIGASVQGKFFPVVSKVEILNETQTKDGVVFYVKFTKNYNCKFIGINWYNGNERLYLEFLEDHDDTLLSRPPGDQYTGPWKLHNILTTKGTTAKAVHECPPKLWQTITDFHP